ncbi:MAG: regulatory protein RecX [Candidatus Omnitrophota bacterium]
MKVSLGKDELSQAKNAALRLLKFQARSEKEIRDRLRLKKFSKTSIEETMIFLKDTHLIDDRQLTKEWIQGRLSKPIGAKRVFFELEQKGVPQKIIQEELANAKIDSGEQTNVLSLAKQRLQKYRHLPVEKAKRRTYEYLAYRGFEPEVISEILDQL